VKTSNVLLLAALACGFSSKAAGKDLGPISGSYLEVRSCDVYTGPCFANGQMGLAGKEGILVWSVREGSWEGTPLGGLKVIAVVRANGTLGNLHYQPRTGKAVLIVDDRATEGQKKALADFARSMAGSLIKDVVAVKALPISAELGTCAKSGCAEVRAGNLVEVTTRCLESQDHICGNETAFYPPLTAVSQAWPAYTEVAAFHGRGLGLTWDSTCQRSAFLGSFSQNWVAQK
jgi:Protein of unknown function (DUF1326)